MRDALVSGGRGCRSVAANQVSFAGRSSACSKPNVPTATEVKGATPAAGVHSGEELW